MFIELPLWPMVSYGECPTLLSITEVEEFAPQIECDLPDDATLAEALSVPGGLAVFCHRQRLLDEATGLSACSRSQRRKLE